MAVLIYSQRRQARNRLKELGLTFEPLQKAAQAAYSARVMCTDNDPPLIPGIEAWRFAVRTLREELLSLGGWQKSDPGNYALVTHQKLEYNIAVASGDSSTGYATLMPKTATQKGLYTRAAIERNSFEPDLFPDTIPEEVVAKARALGHPTWLFLLYTTDDEVRAELSYPQDFGAGEITSWKERIIIPDLQGGLDIVGDNDDVGPDFDVDVQLRG